MGRWEPGGRDRLRAAAIELFVEHGFDETTTAEIAGRAGLTERTFFRHFADKREVLFAGQEVLERSMVKAVAEARADATPLGAVAVGLAASADYFEDAHRDYSRLRYEIITAHDALQERELLKMAALARSVGAALRARGVAEPSATLAAESGITVFRLAFERWIAEDETRGLADIERAMFVELGAVAAGS